MITNAGAYEAAKLFGNQASAVDFAYIAYGSGTTAAAAGDTTLATETARVAATGVFISKLAPNDTIRFTASATPTAAGSLAEVGVLSASSGGTLLQRRVLPTAKAYKANAVLEFTVEVTMKDGGHTNGSTW